MCTTKPFKAGGKLVATREFLGQPGWRTGSQDVVELRDWNLDEVGFAGDESVPACRVLGNEGYFDAIGKRRSPSFQRFQFQVGL